MKPYQFNTLMYLLYEILMWSQDVLVFQNSTRFYRYATVSIKISRPGAIIPEVGHNHKMR